MKIVLFGPPAAGKGTQAMRLQARLGLAHLSTGDMLRAEIARRSALGLQLERAIEKGELVADETVISLIQTALDRQTQAFGAIFDGFPRTLAQATALDAMLDARSTPLDLVISLHVADPLLLDRIAERFKASGRPDDNPDAFAVRLSAYRRQTLPLLDYYRAAGRLVEIDGANGVDAVAADIQSKLAPVVFHWR